MVRACPLYVAAAVSTQNQISPPKSESEQPTEAEFCREPSGKLLTEDGRSSAWCFELKVFCNTFSVL